MDGVTAMDNAEADELVTVLLRLEGLEGMAHGRQSADDLGVAATGAQRTGIVRKMLASIRSWLIVPGK
jgi:hypothetical protein